MAAQDKRILRDVKRLLYSVEKLFRWKAAEALGKISAVIAQKDPGAISKLLQGLFTSVSDTASGGVLWMRSARSSAPCPIISPASSPSFFSYRGIHRSFQKSCGPWERSARLDLTCSEILIQDSPSS
jgi:hypothetical protein